MAHHRLRSAPPARAPTMNANCSVDRQLTVQLTVGNLTTRILVGFASGEWYEAKGCSGCSEANSELGNRFRRVELP